MNIPENDNQQATQWAVFYIKPDNAILYIDTTMYMVHDGKAQIQMPVGEYKCKVESPFYEPWQGPLLLSNTERTNMNVALQPTYAFITVTTPLEGSTIFLDGDSIGTQQATSHRLTAGKHNVSVVRNNVCFLDSTINVDIAEKKTITLNPDICQQKLYLSTLNIISNEMDVNVYIDGIYRGTTPLTLNDMLVNHPYTVKLTKEKFNTEIKTVTLKYRETKNLNVELSKKQNLLQKVGLKK